MPLHLLAILITHLIADYGCQSNWIAYHKRRRWDVLALHGLIYTSLLGVSLGWTLGWTWVLENGLLHVLVDAGSSRLKGYLEETHRHRAGVWVIASLDQFLHLFLLLHTQR